MAAPKPQYSSRTTRYTVLPRCHRAICVLLGHQEASTLPGHRETKAPSRTHRRSGQMAAGWQLGFTAPGPEFKGKASFLMSCQPPLWPLAPCYNSRQPSEMCLRASRVMTGDEGVFMESHLEFGFGTSRGVTYNRL